MKKFQMKNKFNLIVLMASIFSVLIASVITFNFGKNHDLSQENPVASASGGVIEDLADDNSVLESSFDLSEIYPILPENQTTSNLCWVFSSAKVLETSFMVQKNEYMNISETGMAYLAYKKGVRDSISTTGKFENFSTVASNYGLIYESDFANDKYFDMSEANSDNFSYVLDMASFANIDRTAVVSFSTDEDFDVENRVEILKRYIKKYGGVFAGIKDGIVYKDDVWIYSTNKELEAKKEYFYGDHAVCLIGWDDAHGFLALNSWGTKVSHFYIPFNDSHMYKTLYGYLITGDDKIEETANADTAKFNTLTKYEGEVENIICYGDDVKMTYQASESATFDAIYVNVFKGTENLTKDFIVEYDDAKRQISVAYNGDGSRFLGGNYLIKFYESNKLVSVKTIYVFTGAEISYFTLVKDDYAKTEDAVILNESHITSANSTTFYVDPLNTYKLNFGLTDANKYSVTDNSLVYSVSTAYAYTITESNTTTDELAPLKISIGILSDIQNKYSISIPQLYNYRGKIIKFSVTVNSNITDLESAQTYYFNLIVSSEGTILTKSAYGIEYVLDGGLNSLNNLERYANYELDPDATGFKLHNPTKSGAEFDGWYLDAEFKSGVTFIDKSFSGDIAIYAKWKKPAEVVYFTSSFVIDSLKDHDGKSKNLNDDIVYGDTVGVKYVFEPAAGLDGVTQYIIEYVYYFNGNQVDAAFIQKNNLTVQKSHGFPNLDVGEYEIEIEVVLSISHSISISETKKISFEVEQKVINAHFKNLEYEYDKKAHRPSVYVAQGEVFAEDDPDFIIELLEESKVDVGRYTFKQIRINNDNYVLAETEGCVMVISPLEITLVWDMVETVYNAQPQTPTYKIEGLLDGDSIVVNFDFEEMIKAGKYTISVNPTALSNGNYTLTETSDCEFTIKRKPATLTFSNITERFETSPELRRNASYTITGLLEDEEVLCLDILCPGKTATESGEYPITAIYDNPNYDLTIVDGVYNLTGYYYVYYELPDGTTHIEEVEDGKQPKGISSDVYKVKPFQKIIYSQELKSNGQDLHIVVEVKDYTWVVIVVPLVLAFIVTYFVISRKQRRNKVG